MVVVIGKLAAFAAGVCVGGCCFTPFEKGRCRCGSRRHRDVSWKVGLLGRRGAGGGKSRRPPGYAKRIAYDWAAGAKKSKRRQGVRDMRVVGGILPICRKQAPFKSTCVSPALVLGQKNLATEPVAFGWVHAVGRELGHVARCWLLRRFGLWLVRRWQARRAT